MSTCASFPHHQSLHFSFCAFSPFFSLFPLFSLSCPSYASFSSPSQDFDATLGAENQNVTNSTESFLYQYSISTTCELHTILWISFIFTGLVRTPLFLSSSRLLKMTVSRLFTTQLHNFLLPLQTSRGHLKICSEAAPILLTGSQRADPL